MTTVTVHIAGPVEGGLQLCIRCGAVLINYRGKTVMVAKQHGMSEGGQCPQLSFWPEGGFIGLAGAGSVLMKQDASCIDEIACGSSVQ